MAGDPLERDRSTTKTFGVGREVHAITEKRWSAKYRIVVEALTTSEETAEICRKHDLSSNIFRPCRKKLLEAAKAAMAGKSNTAAAKALQKENDRPKTLGRVHLGR